MCAEESLPAVMLECFSSHAGVKEIVAHFQISSLLDVFVRQDFCEKEMSGSGFFPLLQSGRS